MIQFLILLFSLVTLIFILDFMYRRRRLLETENELQEIQDALIEYIKVRDSAAKHLVVIESAIHEAVKDLDCIQYMVTDKPHVMEYPIGVLQDAIKEIEKTRSSLLPELLKDI